MTARIRHLSAPDNYRGLNYYMKKSNESGKIVSLADRRKRNRNKKANLPVEDRLAELELTNTKLVDVMLEQQELIADLDARIWKIVRLLKRKSDQKQKRRG